MSAYRTAALLLKGVLVLRDTFQQRVLSCHGFDVLLQLFACLGNLQGRKEGNVPCGLWEQAVTAELLYCSHGFVVCAPSASSGCQGYSPFCTLGQYSPFASRSSPPSSADPVPFSTVPSLSYPEPFCPVTNRDGTCLKYSQASARAR